MRKAVLARVDVLGFTNKAHAREEIYEILKNQRDIVNSGFDHIRKATGNMDEIVVSLYGDTIDIVFWTGSYWDPSLAYQVVESVARLQIDLISRHLLVRGAIVQGEVLYDPDNKSFTGPAMVAASELEKDAPGPFVIVDGDVQQLVYRNIDNEYNSMKDRIAERSGCFITTGGPCRLNFLSLGCPNHTSPGHASMHRKSIIDTAEEYLADMDQGSMKQLGRIEQLIIYYNSVCGDENQIRYEVFGCLIRFFE